jgi:hypothetical protein
MQQRRAIAQKQRNIPGSCKLTRARSIISLLTSIAVTRPKTRANIFVIRPIPQPISSMLRSRGERRPPQIRCISGMTSFATWISPDRKNSRWSHSLVEFTNVVLGILPRPFIPILSHIGRTHLLRFGTATRAKLPHGPSLTNGCPLREGRAFMIACGDHRQGRSSSGVSAEMTLR